MTAAPELPDSFHALDKYQITGRGTVYAVEYSGRHDPRALVGRTVSIDGTTYLVRGVEMHAIPWPRSGREDKPVNIGLLVRPVSAEEENENV